MPPIRLAWTMWGLGALLYLIAFFQRVAPAVMTDQLMTEFTLGAAALGNLSAFYFYSYVFMQIPTGVLADRWGPRRLLTVGAAVGALGGLLFAMAPTLFWANAGRLLVGASVSVAFVSMMKLATHWFAPRHFALATGMALFVGIVGGVAAGVPLRMLVESFGWRPVMGVVAGLTALLAILIWWRVRDDPAEAGYTSHAVPDPSAGAHPPIWRGVLEVLSYHNVWMLLLAPIGLAGSVLTFAGLWGVPYFRQIHGLDTRSAAAITSLLLVSWALGGPILGAWSERLGRRKPIYVVCVVIALICWAIVYYAVPPLPVMIGLLVVGGFASGAMIIGFAFAKESVPPRLMGTVAGVCNMGPLLGGMLLQPGVGWILDRHWQGLTREGARIYDAAAYQAGFSLMFATLAASLLLILLARETYCKQSA